jgi:hypothetical protein
MNIQQRNVTLFGPGDEAGLFEIAAGATVSGSVVDMICNAHADSQAELYLIARGFATSSLDVRVNSSRVPNAGSLRYTSPTFQFNFATTNGQLHYPLGRMHTARYCSVDVRNNDSTNVCRVSVGGRVYLYQDPIPGTPVVRGSASNFAMANISTGAATATVPSGIQAGDLMVWIVTLVNSNVSFVTPLNWEQVATCRPTTGGPQVMVLQKIAASGEGNIPFTMQTGGNTFASHVLAVQGGVKSVQQIQCVGSSGSSMPTPTLRGLGAGRLLIHVYANSGNDSGGTQTVAVGEQSVGSVGDSNGSGVLTNVGFVANSTPEYAIIPGSTAASSAVNSSLGVSILV